MRRHALPDHEDKTGNLQRRWQGPRRPPPEQITDLWVVISAIDQDIEGNE